MMMQQRFAGARPAAAARLPGARGLPLRAALRPAAAAAAAAAAATAAPRLPARLAVRASASGAAAPMPARPAKPAAPIGVKPIPAAISVAVGLIVNFLIPAPAGITAQAWQLFAIFISTICGLVLGPLPVGAWAFIGLTTVVATGTLPFASAMSAMTSEVIWLIVISFFFAKAFETTGLGERIANVFVAAMGKSSLGLAYGLMVAELLLSPAMPSSTARAGGIFMPIIKFLSKGVDGEPETGGRKKVGAFLVQNQLQTSAYSSALFLTSGAQNLLCINLAAKLGAVVPDVWMNWFIGCLPQAILGMVITPLLLFKQYPPEVKETPEAPAQAQERLKKMGPMSRNELITTATIVGAVVLWIMGDAWGVPAVLAAMLGLATLLLTGVLSWRDCLEYPPAWDCLTWFAVLVSMSSALNDTGLITTFADIVGKQLTSMNLGWQPVFFLLHTAFFFIHYLFAGQTAHVGALFTAFLAMMLASGVPPMLAVLSLGYNTNLFGNITHYASGQAAIYFGNDYVTLPEWFSLGFIYGALSLVITIGLGFPWWKFLGWC